MFSGIYCIENKINGKKYIGQAKDIKDRWSRHKTDLKENVHVNSFLQNSWNKYGEENFIFYIIEIILPKEERNNKEIYYIEHFDTLYPRGLNLNAGGKCANHSEKTKRKLSEINTGSKNPHYGKHRSEETKRKISEAKKGKYLGRSPWNKGIPCSEIAKEKLSLINKGKKLSEKTKERIGIASFGRNHTEETKRKLSEINTGKKHTEETKQKISDAKKNISEETRKKMSDSQKKRFEKNRRQDDTYKRNFKNCHN